MMKYLVVLVVVIWSTGVLLSQETLVKTFGGNLDDRGYSITATSDEGYVLTGYTGSNDGDFKGTNRSGSDIFVIKLDSRGDVQWSKTFGGSSNDWGTSITTTPDGGYALCGVTYSNDGDFEGMNKGEEDIFVIKLDSRGDVQWSKTFGGSSNDWGTSITTAPDGGYVLSGETYSNDGDFKGMNKGGLDHIVIKLDSRGDVQWSKTFGGSSDDWGNSISTAPDGGYVLSGVTYSNDGDFEGMKKGLSDIIIIKLDSRGDILWKKMYGGSSYEWHYSINTTLDGGYVLTGLSQSNDGDFEGMNKGEEDIFVIKLDSRGDVQWSKTFGGSSYDVGRSITISPDEGCVLTGETMSSDGDFEGMNKGERDIFVIKLDSRGEAEWKRLFGGIWDDCGYSITISPDKGCVLTGETISNDGDFEGMNKGSWEIFVINLDSNGNLNPSTSIEDHSDYISSFSITPNPLSPLSTISYSLDKPSRVRIEVVNSIGEVVSVLSDKQEDVGSHQIPFNTTHLVTGTYSVRLVENNRVMSKGVVQIR
jgi:hypothetical protein